MWDLKNGEKSDQVSEIFQEPEEIVEVATPQDEIPYLQEIVHVPTPEEHYDTF